MPRDHRQLGRSALDTELMLLTAKEVAALLKVKLTWLYDEVEAGRFPVVRLGRQLRFRRHDVASYLDERYEKASDADFSARIRGSQLRRRPGRPTRD